MGTFEVGLSVFWLWKPESGMGGLNEIVPHRLTYLDVWSPTVDGNVGER